MLLGGGRGSVDGAGDAGRFRLMVVFLIATD